GAVGGALRIRQVLRSTQLLAIVFHQRGQHLLAGRDAEREEAFAHGGDGVPQRQRQLHRGDGRGGEPFPGDGSCATLLHGGFLPLVVVTTVLASDGGRSRRSFSAGQFNRLRDIPGVH